MHLRDVLAEHRFLAVVRGGDPDDALRSVVALHDARVGLVEVSLAAADGVGVLARARAELGPEAVIGAGDVVTGSDVVQVEQAGASFVGTPGLAPAAAEAGRLGLPALVGALTPSEVLAATLAGAAAVKLFPAALGGPAYLCTLRRCCPEVVLVPAGGVGDLGSMIDYLAAGARCGGRFGTAR